jgi:hypothetical protein
MLLDSTCFTATVRTLALCLPQNSCSAPRSTSTPHRQRPPQHLSTTNTMPLTRSHTILFSAPISRSVQGDPSETNHDRERRNNVFRMAQQMCDRRDAGLPTADISMPSIIERYIHRIPEDRELEEATHTPTAYEMAAECMHKRYLTITMNDEDWANMVSTKMRACGLGMNCPPITRLIEERKRSVKVCDIVPVVVSNGY